jgi:uncharacterized protein YbaP (TraB family)
MKRFLASLLAFVFALGLALPAWAAPPVWRISNGEARITLFGSMHLLTDRAEWETPELRADLAAARSVWFEVPFDAAGRQAAAEAAARGGLLPPGKTLSSLMDPASNARIQKLAPSLGLSAAGLEFLQPWLAEVALGLSYVQQRGAKEAYGVEARIQALAGPQIARKAFETPEQQIGFFADAPLEEQARSLAETLRQIEEEPESFLQMERAWTGGDLKTLEAEALEPLRKVAPGVYDRLVTRRNRAWAAQIERLLKSGEQAFIVVGVGHLIGPGGVPALVRARGYRVEGP